MPTISVTIPVANFWPSSEDLSARDNVMKALTELGFGSPIGCGSGRGTVDFSYHIADSDSATEMALGVVRKHFPKTAPQIRVI